MENVADSVALALSCTRGLRSLPYTTDGSSIENITLLSAYQGQNMIQLSQTAVNNRALNQGFWVKPGKDSEQ